MPKRHGRFSKSLQTVEILLEQGSLADIRSAKQLTANLLKYYWNYYSELARQRNEIQDEIKQVLVRSCISNFEFKQWQRAVKYKYGLHPLSTIGSLNYIGGRFNTGIDVNSEVPSFPGLYLAKDKDKDTALQEHLGQEKLYNKSKLTPRELALTNPSSETIVSISGQLEKVFDLTKEKKLKQFVKLIKTFKLSKELINFAKQLGMKKPGVIKTTKQLLETLLHNEWRSLPSNHDVPANSQIFGHLIYSAGIEGILYSSKFTGKQCLAIYPRNFAETNSFLLMDDDAPHKKVPTLIDEKNWRFCELSFNELPEI